MLLELRVVAMSRAPNDKNADQADVSWAAASLDITAPWLSCAVLSKSVGMT